VEEIRARDIQEVGEPALDQREVVSGFVITTSWRVPGSRAGVSDQEAAADRDSVAAASPIETVAPAESGP
jgi:hypothetical protein